MQKEGLSRTGTSQFLMTTAGERCLTIVESFIDFGNKRSLQLVPCPSVKVICLFNYFFFFLPNAETMYLMVFKS